MTRLTNNILMLTEDDVRKHTAALVEWGSSRDIPPHELAFILEHAAYLLKHIMHITVNEKQIVETDGSEN